MDRWCFFKKEKEKMETKLYVGNLPFDTTEEEINTLFAQAGEVKTVTLISDKFSGQSKGFGFVEMANQEGMQNALKMFETYTFKDRPIKVNVARPKEDRRPQFRDNRNRRDGGGGGGGGGRSRY
jgi:RNA recognition motif-containing protein